MTSLTRDAARRRAEPVSVEHYALRSGLTLRDRHVDSTATIGFRATPGSSTFVDAAASGSRWAEDG